MYIYIYVYVYICICMYMYIYICIHTYIYIYIYTHAHTYIYISIDIYIYVCLCTCIYIPIFVLLLYVRLDSFICASCRTWQPYIYICIHHIHNTYMYIYIYVYMWIYKYIYVCTCEYMKKDIYVCEYMSIYICTQHVYTLNASLQCMAWLVHSTREWFQDITWEGRRTATHCNTLQHTLKYTLQHALQRALQITLQHTHFKRDVFHLLVTRLDHHRVIWHMACLCHTYSHVTHINHTTRICHKPCGNGLFVHELFTCETCHIYGWVCCSVRCSVCCSVRCSVRCSAWCSACCSVWCIVLQCFAVYIIYNVSSHIQVCVALTHTQTL